MCSENHPQTAGWGWGTEHTVWNSLISHCILCFLQAFHYSSVFLWHILIVSSPSSLLSFLKSLLLYWSASCSSGKGPNLVDWISADWDSMQMLEDRIEVSAASMLFSQQDTWGRMVWKGCTWKWWCRILMTAMQSKKVQTTLETSQRHALKTAAFPFLCFVALIGCIKFILQTRVKHKREKTEHNSWQT